MPRAAGGAQRSWNNLFAKQYLNEVANIRGRGVNQKRVGNSIEQSGVARLLISWASRLGFCLLGVCIVRISFTTSEWPFWHLGER